MAMDSLSSISVCPINFRAFDELNKKLQNVEAALLFSKLKFHQTYTKIIKSNKPWIVRSRDQIAAWFGFSTKKIDRLLAYLEEKELIEKNVGLWYGKKRLFISTSTCLEKIPVNLELLEILTTMTSSIKCALIFSKIAYAFANTKIEHDDKLWCCLTKVELAKWSGLSVRSIDSITETLIRTGFILKKKFIFKEKLQSHYHIPNFVISSITERRLKIKESKRKPKDSTSESVSKPIQSQNCREQPAKMGKSIIISTKTKETNNNTTPKPKAQDKPKNAKSDIVFDSIAEELSNRQLKYLNGALKNTVMRKNIKISSPNELMEQIKFSITHQQQRKNISSFKHAVSRCMKILADGNWKTPMGFNKHSSYGAYINKLKQQKANAWKVKKEKERVIPNKLKNIVTSKFGSYLNNNQELTKQAVRLAKKAFEIKSQFENSKETNLLNLASDLMAEIEGLVRKGADKQVVVNCLRGGN